MGNAQSVVAWALAVATVFAGVVCACEGPSPLANGDAAAQHAHHQAAESEAGHCAQASGCADCRVDAVPADRQMWLLSATPVEPDDAFAADVMPQARALPPRMRSRYPPPRLRLRPADTPVHRFDILLN